MTCRHSQRNELQTITAVNSWVSVQQVGKKVAGGQSKSTLRDQNMGITVNVKRCSS
jgi:hypothetical protein